VEGNTKDRSFRLLLLARVMRSVGISFSSLALPIYMLKLGFSTVLIGLTFSLMTVVGSALVFGWGLLGDRFGYKKVVILVELLFAASALILSLTSGSLPLIVLAAVIGGYGGMGAGGLRGAFGPGLTALVGSIWKEPEERVRKLGSIMFVAGIAGIVGYGFLGVQGWLSTAKILGELESFRAIYLLTFFAALVGVVSLIGVSEAPHPKKEARILTNESRKFVSKVVASNVVNAAGIGIVIPLLPLWFLTRFGYDSTVISLIYAVSSAISAVSSYYSHVLTARIRTVSAASLTRALNGAFLIAMAFSPIGAIAAALYLIRGLSSGLGAPIRQSIMISGVSESEMGTASSLSGVSTRLSFLSSGLGGYLLAVAENSPLLVGGILQLFGGALFYRLLHNRNANHHPNR
jgi:MFS family permease